MNTARNKIFIAIALFFFSGFTFADNSKSVALKKEDGQFYIVDDRPLILTVVKKVGAKVKDQTMNTGQHPSTYKKVFSK